MWIPRAIPHNSKCRYGERGAADAKPKAQIILDAAKVKRRQKWRKQRTEAGQVAECEVFAPKHDAGPQPDIIEHFGNAGDAVPQLPERCLSRKAELCGVAQGFLTHNPAAFVEIDVFFLTVSDTP